MFFENLCLIFYQTIQLERGCRSDPLNEARQTISSNLKIALTMKETSRKFAVTCVLHIQILQNGDNLFAESTVFKAKNQQPR
jgi:hypothetical protein